jgi:hypothetical protein
MNEQPKSEDGTSKEFQKFDDAVGRLMGASKNDVDKNMAAAKRRRLGKHKNS